MFSFKKRYFLIIESTKYFDLRNIKKLNKFTIIYRNNGKKERIEEIKKFKNNCRLKKVKFLIANDFKLMINSNSDGIYISASNKSFKSLHLDKFKYEIVGSAHNLREIDTKIKQGCMTILFSKLFLVDYDKKSAYLGLIRFNQIYNYVSKKLVPLGGIKISNLNTIKNLNCNSIAILSALKKKPANIINRLF